jgi:hypothetical protein
MSMGGLAALDEYSMLYGPQPEPQAPPPRLPDWAAQAAVRPESYAPQVGSWPTPQPPKALPDVGASMVGDGGTFSRGLPAVNRAADVASNLAYDAMMPSGPLDLGLSLATGGGSKALKLAAGAIGALAEPSDAEAAKLIKYPFNRIAVGDTPENLAKLNRLTPTKAIEERVIQPHDIPVGSWLTPLVGDRSASGKMLTHVGEKELYSPVWMQGGYEFMPEWQKQGVAWGSDKSPTSAIAGRIKRMQQEGTGDVYGAYTSMTPFSVDASHHMSDTVSQLLRTEKGDPIKGISSTAVEKFNDKMKELDPKFPGVMSEILQPYLRDKSMAFRDKFIKTMNSREAHNAGFPDVEQARIAVTHPELMNTPTYSGGQSIGKMTGEVSHGEKGTTGLAPHLTYRSKLHGQYEGGMPALPQEVLWRDFAAKVAQRDPSAVGKIWLTGLKGEHMGQKVTPRWQDNAAEYLRRNPMGALAAQDHYQP